jgi:hypothetical protein
MSKARVVFQRLFQDSQNIGSDEDHMVSRVFFTLDVDGKTYEDMYVDVTQPYGTDFQEEPVEVGPPQGSYEGNWNHNEFREAVEHYYRSSVGAQGRGIRLGPGVQDVRMRNNTFAVQGKVEFDIPE